MQRRVPEKITLFDRVALAVGGAVIGYLSGLALGWASFMFFGAVMGLLSPTPATGKLFFYHLPLTVTAISTVGCSVLPNQTATFMARMWHVVLALSRRT